MTKSQKKKGRGSPLPVSPSEENRSERDFVIQDRFREDLQHWILSDSRMAVRILELMDDIKRSPFEGKGKPEPLKHNLQGTWSRRISSEHRLVYAVQPDRVLFVSARFHY